METERAPGSLALMTRGPEGSAVRSNIRPMVQEGAAALASDGPERCSRVRLPEAQTGSGRGM
jgi:hypothetical protein